MKEEKQKNTTTKNFCIILAGGTGSRLWPVSRLEKPKQFLDWFGSGKTLLQQTYDRFRQIMKPDHIFVVTESKYADLTAEQLPELPNDRILKEPIRRNTLPSVSWATTCIKHLCPDANVIVSPADQLIFGEDKFFNDVLEGLNFVSQNEYLLSMGVKPTRAETSYGYIQACEHSADEKFFKVKSFSEKPTADFAKVFMESGEFFWNTGLYIYNVNTLMKAIHDLVPDYRESLIEKETNSKMIDFGVTPTHFTMLPNLSLDYSIMEKSENVYIQTCSFGWADLGSWTSLWEVSNHDNQGNAILNSKALLYNSEGNVVCLPKGRIAVIDGLNNYIISEKDDVLLICPKEHCESLRRMTTDALMKLGKDYV